MTGDIPTIPPVLNRRILDLIEAADYAVDVLNRWADFQDDGNGGQEANPPLRALTDLENAASALEKLLQPVAGPGNVEGFPV